MTTLWITLILLGIAVLYFGLKLLIIWLLWDAAVSKADVLMRALKNLDSHEFVCLNCGAHFKKKWWLYAFSPFSHQAVAALTFGKTNFKCPTCGKYDTCVVVRLINKNLTEACVNTRNSCYTYFKIVGNFNPDDISELLNLTPEKTWKIGELRPNGTKYDFAHWEIGRCMEYDAQVENQMRKTIAVLQDKIPLLGQIKKEYDVSLYLVVVPTIYVDDINPCLDPSLDVMDFCHATRTEIAIDMYLYNSDGE